HLLESAGTFFIKPVHDLSGAIRRLREFAELLLKLGEQERFDLAEVPAATSISCPPGAMRGDVSGHCHSKPYGPAAFASNRRPVTFVCCDQTLCHSSCFVSRDHIPNVGMRFTR